MLKRCAGELFSHQSSLVKFFTYALFFAMAQDEALAKQNYIVTEHPLINKIWNVHEAKFVNVEQFINDIADTKYLLLGERHDNQYHHKHQAWIVEQLNERAINASVSFEMIDNAQKKMLTQEDIKASENLIIALDKSKNNWDYQHQYKPVFDAVLEANYRIEAANLHRKKLMKTAKQGQSSYPEDMSALLSQSPLDKRDHASLLDEINTFHCDMLDAETSGYMLEVQRIRDAVMALSLINSREDMRVLVAGAGHTRSDRGVPLYLKAQDKEAKVISLAFIEVSEGETQAEAYTARWGTEQLPFDYVWFTPQVEREDACEMMKRHFKKKKAK